MEGQIKITIQQLEYLLNQQKEIVIEKLRGCSYLYNKESTDSNAKSLPIDEAKFKNEGLKAAYPTDFNVLKRHVI